GDRHFGHVLRPRPGAPPALGGARGAGRRDGGRGAVHDRRDPWCADGLHSDRVRSGRRGRPGADRRPGAGRRRRADDAAGPGGGDRREGVSGSTDTVMVVNPASANGKTARQWPEIARQAQELGLDVDVRLTEQGGHAVELAREAASAGAQLVVAVGGDGTVSEVANGLVEAGADHSCEMAVIARGSGCDFIRTFAIPKNTEKALDVVLNGTTRR